jgi:hypothetical protein
LEITCQRCHEPIHDVDRYCSSCGLPQLIYVAAETPVMPLEDGQISAGGDLAGLGSGIAWRPALQTAMLLAIPAGLLSSSLTPVLALVWIMGAAAWAVGLYAKRLRTGGVSTGNGARIGLVTGLFTAWLWFAANGVALWVTRFLRHQGGQIDSEWVGAVKDAFERNQQMVAQAGMSGAQATQFTQIAQWMQGLMLSPEGRAGCALAGLLVLAAILLVFATIGGAVGARFLTTTRRPSA